MPNCDRPCGCGPSPNVEDGKWYGVRSYLHLFYEDCAGTALSDDPEGPPILCPRRPWPSLCWKVRPEEEQLWRFPMASGERCTQCIERKGMV